MGSILNFLTSVIFKQLIFFIIFVGVIALVFNKAGFHVFSGWLLLFGIILFNIWLFKEYLIKYPKFGILYVGFLLFDFLFDIVSKPACHCIFQDSELFLFANWFKLKISEWINLISNGFTMLFAGIIIVIGLIAALKEIRTGKPVIFYDRGTAYSGVSFKKMLNTLLTIIGALIAFFGVQIQSSFIQCFPCQMICKMTFELDNFIKCFWDNII